MAFRSRKQLHTEIECKAINLGHAFVYAVSNLSCVLALALLETIKTLYMIAFSEYHINTNMLLDTSVRVKR